MLSSKTPHIIGTSPDDAPMMSYYLLVGKYVHAPGHLSVGSCSEQNTRANALISYQLKGGEMAAPGTCCDTLPQVF